MDARTTILRESVLRQLKALDENAPGGKDWESAHGRADDLILLYLRSIDPEIAEAFNRVGKWYA